MMYRPLGRSGLACAALAFGGNVFGWTADEATSFRLLDTVVDAGFNLVDTADVYSIWQPGSRGGESETIIGRWLARSGKRHRVLLATKLGYEMPEVGQGLSRAHIERSVDLSLRRLHTDVIDLYQAHCEDPETPHEETLSAFADLISAGKVRAIGCSNFTPATLRAALECSARLGLPRYEVVQPLYNLCDRTTPPVGRSTGDRVAYEGELQALCAAETLGVIPYFALAAGFLTGKYRTQADLAASRRAPRAKSYMTEHGFRIVDALEAVAARFGATPGQVAIAWLMTRPTVTAPIASGRTVEQVLELLGAARLTLDADALAFLDQASAPVA